MTVCEDVSKSKTKFLVRDRIVFESGTKLHLSPGPSLNVCVSVLCMSAFESKTKLHLDQGSNRSEIWNQIAFGFENNSERVRWGD